MGTASDALTTQEAAALLGVSTARIRQMIGTGVLAAQKHGRDHLIARADVEAARGRRTTPGRPVTTGAGLRRRGRVTPEITAATP